MQPTAGWYPDPAGDDAWRWWDGTAWTDHVRAAERAAAPAPAEPAPAEPAPAAPEPARIVPAHSVPQPGERTGPPAGTHVSSAVDIPVTDQLYWHSNAAEMIEVPRLPHHTVSNAIGDGNRRSPGFVRDWQDLGSPNTAGIWLMAAMPLMSIPLGLGLGLVFAVAGVPDLITRLVASGVGLGLYWVFAYLDQRALGQRGYHAPAIWWMLLLPPLVYFIKRGRAVRRENMRAWPPELLFVGSVLLLIAAGVYLAYTASLLAGQLPPIG